MSEEVKVNIRTEADLRGAVDAKAKIVELREEAARLRQSAEVYSSKYGFEDSRARTARSEASTREREANRLERPIIAEQKTAHKEERDEKAKSIREHRAAQRAAAAEERADIREVARERRQAEAQQQTTGRMLFGGGRSIRGGMIGGAAVFGIGEAFMEYTERQGIALRAAAQRKLDERGLAIAGSWRGSSSQTLAQVHGLNDDIARQEANRPELERKARTSIFDRALGYGAAGAGTGFALSGGNPIGAGIGFVAGVATGAWRSYSEGEREKDEDKATLAAKRKKREELEALGKKQVREQDGQIEMDIAAHRAERTMSGSRAVVVDEAKKKYLNRYRELRSMNIRDEEAHKTAGLEAETSLRDRQMAAGASLVNARSGAGDIAAAARWGSQATPGMAEVTTAIKGLHGTVKKGNEAAERIDQSVK